MIALMHYGESGVGDITALSGEQDGYFRLRTGTFARSSQSPPTPTYHSQLRKAALSDRQVHYEKAAWPLLWRRRQLDMSDD
jgi:hypothetical protein